CARSQGNQAFQRSSEISLARLMLLDAHRDLGLPLFQLTRFFVVFVLRNTPRAVRARAMPRMLVTPQPKKIYSLSGLPSTAAGIFWVCPLHAHILPPRMSACSTPILRSPCRRSRCASLVGHN